ncbi:MAG: hypothetical protein RLZZ200_2620 [Pseudomonadota bacterium]
MSGWIKIEKSLETDPRVLRMAKGIDRMFLLFPAGADLDPCNAASLPAVTLVCGALSRLWMYADSHIRGDDTLDLGAAELDEWLGIPGFCSLVPADWLREIDEHTVELPGFQAHNGVEAKKKAQTQKRVARHRAASKPDSVTPRNASALPDQTRPDQTRPDHLITQKGAGTRATVSRGTSVPMPLLNKIRDGYPPGTYRDNAWLQAERSIGQLLGEGETAADLVAAAAAYGIQQQALGKVGSQYVLSPAKFFGPEGHWRGPFPLPAKPETAMDRIMRATSGADGRVIDHDHAIAG